MRFQITTGDEKKEYDSFKKAAEDLNIELRTIYRFLQNDIGGGKFQRRSDKKIFWIERTDQISMPLLKIDGVDYFTIPQVLKTFGLREKNFMSQMVKNHFAFVDSNNLPHKVDWVSEFFLDLLGVVRARRLNDT